MAQVTCSRGDIFTHLTPIEVTKAALDHCHSTMKNEQHTKSNEQHGVNSKQRAVSNMGLILLYQ